MTREVHWHQGEITREDRERLNGHRGITLWFTGLSASGKSTLAVAVEEALHARGGHTFILDGDNIRHGLNRNLGFSPEDREENIRRIGEVARLFREAGVINLTAFISPYRKDRLNARAMGPGDDFVEIFVDCPVAVCEDRDPKGMYKKARAGLIPEFTGISAPYEEPEHPEIHLRTDRLSVEECVGRILGYLIEKRYVSDREPAVAGLSE
ncbi:MAG: adenylyl-sulfate kinase [Proteobacteria bacterium]|nr:adenylyl-sulfate kinase [Pseudomonadota bacterium]